MIDVRIVRPDKNSMTKFYPYFIVCGLDDSDKEITLYMEDALQLNTLLSNAITRELIDYFDDSDPQEINIKYAIGSNR